MTESDLPNPGSYAEGTQLRTAAAKALNAALVHAAQVPGGLTDEANTLQAFFTAGAAALNDIDDDVTHDFDNWTGVVASATQINLAPVSAGDTSILPDETAFTVNNGGVVTSVEWVSATVFRITGTGFAAGDTVTYTVPVSNALRSASGKAVAAGDLVTT
jgi:hypothetical protein